MFVEFTMVTGEGEDDIETTAPIMINTAHVRSFSPRKYGRAGTRIVFVNSAAIPVIESYEQVTLRLRPS